MKDLKNGTCLVDSISDTIESISLSFNISPTTLVSLNPKYLTSVNDSLADHIGTILTVKEEVKSTSSTVTITGFGLQAGTTRSMYLTWAWDLEANKKTENYEVIWSYKTEDVTYAGDTIWYEGSRSTINKELKQSTYSAPEEAVAVKVKVKVNGTPTKTSGTTTNVTWGWTDETVTQYYFKYNPPTTPPVPSVEINKYKLTAELDNINLNATHIEFHIIKDNTTSFHSTAQLAKIDTYHARYSCTIAAGSVYKVRCRSIRADLKSNWSEYSSNIQALPITPTINNCDVLSENSVKIEWTKVYSADNYELEYLSLTNEKYEEIIESGQTIEEYFDSEGVEKSSLSIENDAEDNNTTISRTVYNLATGGQYFVRMRSVNDGGESKWSNIKTFILGTEPESPTTWSSTNSVIIGESLNLYWIHNSEDGSSETWAKLELIVNNGDPQYIYIKKSTDEDEKDKTSVYKYPTEDLEDGAEVKWRICTAGVKTDENGNPAYGEWSIVRTVNIYAPPVVSIALQDYLGETLEKLTTFPFKAICSVGNTANQEPIGYYLSIVSINKSYTTIDDTGHNKIIGEGTILYSKHFDETSSILNTQISANDVDLENGMSYTINCTVSMNSGLTAEASAIFTVGWIEETYAPFADIGINEDSLSAYIIPYSNGGDDVTLSVYRREFDGTFLELATDITNKTYETITDPHPALDYARYRIVAKETSTGAISYSDVYLPVGEKAIIIQWDEQWHNFEATEEVLEETPWSGSMLRLPYNVDVSDSYSPDVSLVKYIGRSHPVSYYGTHIGQTSSWNTEIPKSDKETLYALRRLAIWMGDVYVREPSGSGYWANITVSFSQTHCEVTIPVTLNIKRVEGGV